MTKESRNQKLVAAYNEGYDDGYSACLDIPQEAILSQYGNVLKRDHQESSAYACLGVVLAAAAELGYPVTTAWVKPRITHGYYNWESFIRWSWFVELGLQAPPEFATRILRDLSRLELDE